MEHFSWPSDFASDLRYGLRGVLKSKGFSATVILTMALGIGANTAIFSLINAVLLKSLPAEAPDQLVLLTDPSSSGFSRGISSGIRGGFSWYEYEQIQKQNRSFSELFAAQSGNDNLKYAIGRGPQEEGHGRLVTGNYFFVLGAPAALGRTFSAADDEAGNAAPVAVISDAFWKKRFGATSDVLGKKIRVESAEVTIIGVTRPGFFGERVGESPDMWMPVQLEPQLRPNAGFLKMKDMQWLSAMGRLKPGVSRAQAQAALNVLFQQIIRSEAPPQMSQLETHDYLDQRIVLKSGARGISSVRAQFSEPLIVLMIAVGVVLLIACANVANLLLARATGRTKELSIRLALGAASGRLFRQMLTESILFSLAGGIVSLWIAGWGTRALLVLASQDGTPVPLDTRVDLRVLAFTLGVSLLTGILFGLVPALSSRKIDVAPSLQKTSRGVMEGGSRHSFRNALVVVQIALSLLLLVGAGLLVRTLRKLSETDLGYRRDHLVVASLDFSSAGYKDERLPQVYKQLSETLNGTPAIDAATYSLNGLFSGSESNSEFTIEGYQGGRKQVSTRFDEVGPSYFKTVGIRRVAGRDFKSSDDERAQPVAIANQAFARQFFAKGDPLGKWVRDEYPAGPKRRFTIVGVVADAKDHSLRDKVTPRLYVPMLNGITPPMDFATVEIRTRQTTGSVQSVIRNAMATINASIPVANIRSMDEQVNRQLGTEKLIARLSALFSVLALLLAALGLYGVLAYSVARRTAEMGVRLALGANAGGLIWLIMRETLLLAATGFAIGIPASIGLTRLIGSRLYGVESYDPLTLSLAVLALGCAAGIAGLLPAVRAARIDPLVALRWE